MLRVILLSAVLATSPAWAEGVVSDVGLSGFVTLERLELPEDPVLRAGAMIWQDSCQSCHGGNKATGAPKITSRRAWTPRIEQGLETLASHAINGFLGKTYAQMPARGGNDALSDHEVKSAVAFMVWASGGADPASSYARELGEQKH